MTRQQAINLMCKQCIYDPGYGGGTWRQQTESCTSTNCPLYEYRPLSASGNDAVKEERKANMSAEELARYEERARQAAERLKNVQQS